MPRNSFIYTHTVIQTDAIVVFSYIYLQTLEVYTHNQSRSKHMCLYHVCAYIYNMYLCIYVCICNICTCFIYMYVSCTYSTCIFCSFLIYLDLRLHTFWWIYWDSQRQFVREHFESLHTNTHINLWVVGASQLWLFCLYGAETKRLHPTLLFHTGHLHLITLKSCAELLILVPPWKDFWPYIGKVVLHKFKFSKIIHCGWKWGLHILQAETCIHVVHWNSGAVLRWSW